MTIHSAEARMEIAHRSSDGMDVTLMWAPGEECSRAVVCVCDERTSTYFEIPTEAYLAFYHPFAYRDFSTVHRESSWVAA